MKNIIQLIIYIAVSYTAYILCVFVFEDSPSKEAYGLLCGWWAAAYYANLFNLSINLIKYLFILWAVALSVDLMFDLAFFYAEGGRGDRIAYSLMSGLQFLAFTSPLLFNYLNVLVKLLIKKLVREDGQGGGRV